MQYIVSKGCNMKENRLIFMTKNKRNVCELNKLSKHENFSMWNILFFGEYPPIYFSGFNKIMKYHELGIVAIRWWIRRLSY